MPRQQRNEGPAGPLGPMASFTLWMSRIALVVATVGVPVLFAGSIIRDGSYGIALLFLGFAVAGLVYSVMNWRDPPYWAVVMGRGTAYRRQWHPPES